MSDQSGNASGEPDESGESEQSGESGERGESAESGETEVTKRDEILRDEHESVKGRVKVICRKRQPQKF